MNTGIQDAIVLADALADTLGSGNEQPLNAYGGVRRPIAIAVVRLLTGLPDSPRSAEVCARCVTPF
jgi:2-polyprenyl-6-methoxyphenol hydroxylase-like FAD-dependent oxidoreductase